MNYKQRDDELIKLNKQALARRGNKNLDVGNNSGNVGYSLSALNALAKGGTKALRASDPARKVPSLTKPSTRYEDNTITQSAPKKSTRDTKFDKDLGELWDYRFGDFSGEVDYDRAMDIERPHWETVREQIKRKNKWTDEELDTRFKAYDDERLGKMADQEIKTATDVAKKHPVLGTLLQGLYTPQNMIEGGASMLSNLMPDKYKAQSADDTIFTGTKAKEGIKQTVKDEHIKSGLGKMAYDIGTGLGDRAFSQAIPILGTAALGTQAAARTNMQALERGVDPSKAAATAGIAGVLSGAANKFGLDKALKSDTVAKAAGKEALENILEDTFNLDADLLMNADKSQLATLHDYYVNQGMDDKAAWIQVYKDTGKDLLTSGLTGAAFGGGMKALGKLPSLTGMMGSKQDTDIQNILEGKTDVDPEIQNAIDTTNDAVAKIQELSEQIPKAPEAEAPNRQLTDAEFDELNNDLNNMWADNKTESAPNANSNTKIPEFTMGEDVYFRGSDADIAIAESQDKAIVDTFKNIISDPEFNALSFKNGNKEVFVSPATNGNGLRMSYTIDGVPTGHHDYSLDQIDELSQNLRNEAGNGGEDIKIQRKSDLAKKTQSNAPKNEAPQEGKFDPQKIKMESEIEVINKEINEILEKKKNRTDTKEDRERLSYLRRNETTLKLRLKDLENGSSSTANESAGRNPSITSKLEGAELEEAKAKHKDLSSQLEEKNKAIKAQQDVVNNAAKKNKKAESDKLKALKAEAAELQKQKKDLKRQINGESTPIKEQLNPEDYREIFNERQGKLNDINIAVKFAGDTPEAKQLGRDARALLNQYVESGDPKDYYDFLGKIGELSNLAEATKADYVTKSGTYKYDDVFSDVVDTANGRSNQINLFDKMSDGRILDIVKATHERINGSKAPEVPPETPKVPSEPVNEVPNEPVNKVPEVKTTEPTPPVPPENNRVPEVGDKVRSFSKRGSMDDTLPDEVRNVLSQDYYKVARNADTTARANEYFDENNLTQTRSNLEQLLERKDPASALLSYKLAGAYVDKGEYDAATDVLRQVSEKLTEAGQFTQAAKLAMVKNDPMAAMRMYQRDLDNLNQWGKEKYGKKWEKLKLTDEDKAGFRNIQAGDAEGLSNFVDSLNKRFGKEIPSTLWDKIVGATKTAMLLNPRTQSRNITANIAMLPIRSAADRVSAVGQNIAHLINPNMKVTQSLTGGTREQKKIAKQIFDSMKSDILGENKMKDSTKSDILSNKQTFNDDFFAKWVDNLTNGGVQKLNEKLGAAGNKSTMETLQNFTYWLMGDFGDTPFVRKNFENRLASYMKAQGINKIEDVPDEAIAIATQEALKATFKDDNAFTKAMQGVKKSTGKFGEVMLPFVKTPANLTMRAIDYSPAGLINTFRKIKSGADANTVIDELSKNLTGSAMILLGMKLRDKGILSGNYSEDKDEANFQKRQGMLENAIHVGDKYYTFDWAQPAATPLIIGSVISDAIKASDEDNKGVMDVVNATYKGGMNVANSIINSSPLQSFADMMGSDNNSEDGVAGNIAQEVIEFPQRFIPSLLGATARVQDPVIRDTYTNDNSFTGILKNQLTSAQSKIPGLSKKLPASYDTWGNERLRSNTKGEAAFAQYLNPGQLGNDTSLPIDKDIQALYNKTGNKGVFPMYAPRSVNLGNDGTIKLTNEQHSEYQKTLGQLSYKFADKLVNNAEFKKLSDDEKASMLESAYKLANSLSKEQLFDHVTDSDKNLKEAYKTGGVNGAVEAMLSKSVTDHIKEVTGMSADSPEAKRFAQALRYGDANKAEQQMKEYAAEKQKLDAINKKYDTNITMKTYRENPAEAEQRAADTRKAIDAGFVNRDGSANVDNYQTAVEIVGNNSNALKAYQSYSSHKYTKNAEKIPYLMKDRNFTDEQKGKIVAGTDPSKLGKSAKGMYDMGGYKSVYYYYLLKELADTDHNGSIKKAERTALLNSNNQYVRQLSDKEYNYLVKNLK